MNNSSSPSTAVLPQQPNLGMEEMPKLLPIAIAIVLTNGLVFVLFYKRKSLRTSSNVLLLGLAVCDFITGAVNIPYFIVFSFKVVLLKDFGFWMYILHTLMAISAAYHILVITAEKYLAIIRPLKHYLVTKKTVFKVLVGIWFVSGFIATIPFALREAKFQSLWFVIYSSTCLVIVFLVPYVFMLYAYTVMLKAVSGRNRSSRHRDSIRLRKKNKTDRKCILVFAVMAAIYLCCWFPYFTIMLITSIKTYVKSYDFTAVEKAAEPIAIARFITSAINPLLYTFFKRDFWVALRSLFSSKRKSDFSNRRKLTLRSFSLTYSSVKRRSFLEKRKSIDTTRDTRLSVTADCPRTESDANEGRGEKYVLFVSSV